MRKTYFIIFFIFLFSAFSYADSLNYPHAGYDQGRSGTGYWNSLLTTDTQHSKGLTLGTLYPLVCELDGNAGKEIIVADGDELRIFRNKTLDIADAKTISNSLNWSNIVCSDINSDSKDEVIFYDLNNETIRILKYNGTAITYVNTYNAPVEQGAVSKDAMMNCGGNRCIVLVAASDGGGGNITYYAFDDSTLLSNKSNTADTASASINMCLPLLKMPAYSDSDADGQYEYVFGGMVIDDIHQTEKPWVSRMAINADGTMTTELNVKISNSDFSDWIDDAHCGRAKAGKYVSSPLVMDTDGAASNGLEYVMAIMTDAAHFKLYIINPNTGAIKKDFPAFSEVSTVLMSNVARMSVFGTSERNDFCAIGYDSGNDNIALVCGSDITSYPIRSMQFVANAMSYYPDPESHGVYNYMIHSINTKDNEITATGEAYDELLTPYGVFELQPKGSSVADTTCNLINDCQMSFGYTVNKYNPAIIPIDYEGGGRHDLIVLTNTTLTYYDDGWANTNCDGVLERCLTAWQVCPTTSGTWKQNTSVTLDVTLEDLDGDNLQWRSWLYYGGGANEQFFNWSDNVSSSGSDSRTFIANITTPLSKLRIEVRDTNDPSVVYSKEISFSVAGSGYELGDDCSSSTQINVPTAPGTIPSGSASTSNNSVTNAVDTFTANSGLSRAAIWLILMVIVALGIMIPASKAGNPMIGGIVTAFVEFLVMLLGTIFGYFPVVYFISVMVIAIILVAFGVARVIAQHNTGG